MALQLAGWLRLCCCCGIFLCFMLAKWTLHAWNLGQIRSILYGLWSIVLAVVSLVLWDIQRLNPANSHTFQSLMTQYVLIRVMAGFFYWKNSLRFNTQSENVKETQEKILLESLQFNKGTEYGRNHNFTDIHSMEDFKSKVPLITYFDIESLIDREANGEKGVLTAYDVELLARSTGTVGRLKLIPLCKRKGGRLMLGSLIMGSAVKCSKFDLGRVIGLRYKPTTSVSPGGIPIAPVSHHHSPYHPHFLSPKPAYDIMDKGTNMYVHAVFGLRDREVSNLDGLVTPVVLSFFRVIESRWEDICEDIASGHLNRSLPLESSIRHALDNALTPDPVRAAELQALAREGFVGIAKRIWPQLNSVWATASGAFAVSSKVLSDVYLKGVHLQSNTHSASEGMMGINMTTDPKQAYPIRYTFTPFFSFYEFIPVNQMKNDQPETLFLHQLEKNEEYEIVLTNLLTFYRYRIGDVIKVVDFHNQCPIYEFQYRAGSVLSVCMENTTERQVEVAIQAVMKTLPKDVVLLDYTTTESESLRNLSAEYNLICASKQGSFYIFFVDLEQNGSRYTLNEQQMEQFELELRKSNPEYDIRRIDGRLDSMVVHQVAVGAFSALQRHATQFTNTSQYKTPRVITAEDRLKILLQPRNSDE